VVNGSNFKGYKNLIFLTLLVLPDVSGNGIAFSRWVKQNRCSEQRVFVNNQLGRFNRER